MSLPPHAPATPLHLFALPCAGASATMYLRWRRALPAWITLTPLELPGRGSRLGEPYVLDFDQLVTQLTRECVPQGRFVLFGHSMGALLAWGMAQRWREQGRPLPLALFVSGCAAPSQRDATRYIAAGDDAALIADLHKHGGTPDAVFDSPELLRITLDTLGADYRVCESFNAQAAAALPLPIHVFAGLDDDIAPARIAAWRQASSRAFSQDWFAGGHFFIRQQEAAVLAALTQALVRDGVGHVATAMA